RNLHRERAIQKLPELRAERMRDLIDPVELLGIAVDVDANCGLAEKRRPAGGRRFRQAAAEIKDRVGFVGLKRLRRAIGRREPKGAEIVRVAFVKDALGMTRDDERDVPLRNELPKLALQAAGLDRVARENHRALAREEGVHGFVEL